MNLYCYCLCIDTAPRVNESFEDWQDRQAHLEALPDQVFLAKIHRVWDTCDVRADFYDVGFNEPGNSVRFKTVGPCKVRRWIVEDGLAALDAAYSQHDEDDE